MEDQGGELSPIVTMRDVAELAGVSVKTVSNVANGYAHVRESTRREVQAAIEELGYQMNIPAQALRKGGTAAIGLAVPDLLNPYFAKIAQDVMDEARRNQLRVFIQLTDGEAKREMEAISDPVRSLTRGLILASTGLGPSGDNHALEASSSPLVVLGDQDFGSDVTQITMANVDGARAATQFLIDRGAKRVLLLGKHPGNTATSMKREQGYRQGLESRGIKYDDRLVIEAEDWYMPRGAEATINALKDGVRFDAVFAMNDTLAMGALRALKDAGVHVPDDVQVIGWDNLDQDEYTGPSLTSLDPGVGRMAVDAVKTLVHWIETDGPRHEHSLTVEPFRITERSSTR